MNKYIFYIIASAISFSFISCEEDENTSLSNVNTDSGLVQYYTFDDENANDAAGTYNGLTINSPTYITDTPSGKGKAIFLNSTKEQYINIPYCPVSGKETYSVAFWAKDFGAGTIITTICGNSYNSPTVRVSQAGYIVLHTGGYCNDGRFYSLFSAASIDNYQATGWHHFAVTAGLTENNNDKLLSLYIDGNLADNVLVSSNYVKAEGNKMQIGGNADGKFDYWADPMKIDNVRIYNRCIDAQEVKAIYTLKK